MLSAARVAAEHIGRLKHCGADGKVTLLRGLVVQKVVYGALVHSAAPGTAGAEKVVLLQASMDAAVRGAAASPCLATGVLRLPARSGGLGCPCIRVEMDIARVAEFQRVLNGGSLVARALWIELDRVGSTGSFAGANVPKWPEVHPVEHCHAINLQHSRYNRSSDVGHALCAATRRLGVRIKLQRPPMEVPKHWQPQADEHYSPVQHFSAGLCRSGNR